MYNYGLIGNCQCAALVNVRGSVDWLCMPRPDDPPVFGSLLDEGGGSFHVEAVDYVRSSQEYLTNTNILQTRVETETGVFVITDFFPRFEQFGRMYRPPSLFRKVEVLSGVPVVRVTCTPVSGWDKVPVRPV